MKHCIPFLFLPLLIAGFLFKSEHSAGQCIAFFQNGNYSLPTSCHEQGITASQSAGEFNQSGPVPANSDYKFRSYDNGSNAGFLTITDHLNNVLAFGPSPLTVSIGATPPANLRCHVFDNAGCGTNLDYATTVQCLTCPVDAPTTEQPTTASVSPGFVNAQILKVYVPRCNPGSLLTSMSFDISSCTALSDVTNARVYYTTAEAFSTASQFGAMVSSPAGTFTITGSQALGDDLNIFWLVFDISLSAVANNIVDGAVTSCLVDGNTLNPMPDNPAGTRTIVVTVPNDDCPGAVSVPVNSGVVCSSSVSSTNENSTFTMANCDNTSSNLVDVWFSFVATGATNHTILITPSAAPNGIYSPKLEVFSGNCLSLVPLICPPASATGYLSVTASVSGLIDGNTYYFRVYSEPGSIFTGNFSACVTTPPVPANDNCTGATVVPVNSGTTCTSTVSSSSFGATESQPSCLQGGFSPLGYPDDDVWFQFIPTQSVHTVTVTASAPNGIYSLCLSTFSGSCGNLTATGCFYLGQQSGTQDLTNLTIGVPVFFRIYSGGDHTGMGNFTVCITSPSYPPVNDECGTALVLTVNAGATCGVSTDGSTVNGTQSSGPHCGIFPNNDVWFSFVATANAHSVWVQPAVSGGITDVVMQVLSGSSCGALSSILCVNFTSGTAAEFGTATGLTIGNTYRVRVHNASSAAGNQGAFTICIQTPSIPANDNCAAAVNVPVNPAGSCAQTVAGTTVLATQSLAGCAGTADDDVWYSFVATAPAKVVTVTPAATYGLTQVVFQVFSGTCASPVSLACILGQPNGQPATTTLPNLTVGATYFMRVYSAGSGGAVMGAFDICVRQAANMSYVSSTADQTGPSSVTAGTLNMQIISERITVIGLNNPLATTQLTFSTAGTDNPSDITKARVYFTGTSSSFSTAVQFGSDVIAPNGTFTVTGNAVLTGGLTNTNNYFWLCYDVACSAQNPNHLDAACNSAVVGGSTFVPSVTAPGGFTSVNSQVPTYVTIANGDWSSGAVWACGAPPSSPLSMVTINHNVTISSGAATCGSLTVSATKTLTVSGGTLTMGNSSMGNATGTSNRQLLVNGNLIVSGGEINLNGSMIVNTNASFSMYAGTINLDPNDGTGSGSAAGRTLELYNGSNGAVTGGALNFLDPPMGVGQFTIFYGPSSQNQSWACSITIGGGDDVNVNNTSGFLFRNSANGSKLLSYGDMIISGGRYTDRRHVNTGGGSSIVFKVNNLTVNANAELYIDFDGLMVAGPNLINNGYITNNQGMTGFAISMANLVNGFGTNAATAQTISGSGFFKKSLSDPDPVTQADNRILGLTTYNPLGVTLSMPLSVNNLHINQGPLHTSASSLLTLGIGPPATINPGTIYNFVTPGSNTFPPVATSIAAYTAGWVNGPLRRWVPAGITTGQLGILPVGTASQKQAASILFPTNFPSSGGTLTAQFIGGSPAGGTTLAPPLNQPPIADPISLLSPTGIWDISAGNGLTGGTYNAVFLANSFTKVGGAAIPAAQAPNLVLVKRPTGSSNPVDWQLNGTHVTTTNSGSVFTLSRTGMSDFSEFALAGTAIALPVELTAFTARAVGQTVRLDWQTATETNNKGFYIERSPEGTRWETLGFVAGQGNSSTTAAYSFPDAQPLPGHNYYRLRQQDLDGREEFSPMVQVSFAERSGTVLIYPNPVEAGADCTVTSTHEILSLRLLDITGKQAAVFSNPALFSTKALKPGLYWLEVQSAHGTVMEKLVVQ